ncbi:MAG: iron-containing alcohol dehydrogenase, partial [Alistipes sp.]|nr:iron-containing alcohol dehydrogenase [Alistipes sp.]
AQLVAIPTTSGSGSEVTDFAILTHEGVKHPLVDGRLRPKLAISRPYSPRCGAICCGASSLALLLRLSLRLSLNCLTRIIRLSNGAKVRYFGGRSTL